MESDASVYAQPTLSSPSGYYMPPSAYERVVDGTSLTSGSDKALAAHNTQRRLYGVLSIAAADSAVRWASRDEDQTSYDKNLGDLGEAISSMSLASIGVSPELAQACSHGRNRNRDNGSPLVDEPNGRDGIRPATRRRRRCWSARLDDAYNRRHVCRGCHLRHAHRRDSRDDKLVAHPWRQRRTGAVERLGAGDDGGRRVIDVYELGTPRIHLISPADFSVITSLTRPGRGKREGHKNWPTAPTLITSCISRRDRPTLNSTPSRRTEPRTRLRTRSLAVKQRLRSGRFERRGLGIAQPSGTAQWMRWAPADINLDTTWDSPSMTKAIGDLYAQASIDGSTGEGDDARR